MQLLFFYIWSTVNNNLELYFLAAKNKRTSRQKKHKPLAPEPGPEPEPEQPHREPHNGECLFCFLRPCVASRNYDWIGNGQYPSIDNSAIRRVKYASFWKVMTNLGAWKDPRYIAAKVARANGGEWAICHKREVMPMCVLQKLRSLYPNPKDMPYMDHKWQ